jgi:MFS family permease
MNASVLIPALTALLGFVFAAALFDQWRQRRRTYQLIWAAGMLFYGVAAACEALAFAGGWNELLYRAWFLVGGVWLVGWLGLGTAYLLQKTRFGYGFALCIFLAGLFTALTPRRNPAEYADAGILPLIYFAVAAGLAIAIVVATYFQNERWPWFAAAAVVGATVLSIVLMATITLPSPGYLVQVGSNEPDATLFPSSLRLLTPFMNITGAFALVLGALFSAYVFMPKRRVLNYSLDPGQPGDQFLFNLLISPVAITVNFFASIPGAARALIAGRIHSRVPATLIIAVGAFIPTVTDAAYRLGSPALYEAGHLLGVVLIFAGFLVSIEVFRDIRIPFTSRVLRAARQEHVAAAGPVSDQPN